MIFCSAVLEEQWTRDWDGRTGEQTKERTDIRITIYPSNFICGGYNNKQPMGHNAHLRNKHIWANLWLYRNIDWEGKNQSVLYMYKPLNKFEFLSPYKNALCQVSLKLENWHGQQGPRRGLLQKISVYVIEMFRVVFYVNDCILFTKKICGKGIPKHNAYAYIYIYIYIDNFHQGMNMVELSIFQSRFLTSGMMQWELNKFFKCM